MARIVLPALLLPASDALLLGTNAAVVRRAPAPRAADFSSFEKSFTDELYKEEFLDKNKALHDMEDALPKAVNGFKADGLALREGIDEAREAGATVYELKRFVEALKKADPSLFNEVDAAILLGAEQVVEAGIPQPARPPPDSYLTPQQFQALRQASMSGEPSAEGKSKEVPKELLDIWGRPLSKRCQTRTV